MESDSRRSSNREAGAGFRDTQNRHQSSLDDNDLSIVTPLETATRNDQNLVQIKDQTTSVAKGKSLDHGGETLNRSKAESTPSAKASSVLKDPSLPLNSPSRFNGGRVSSSQVLPLQRPTGLPIAFRAASPMPKAAMTDELRKHPESHEYWKTLDAIYGRPEDDYPRKDWRA